MSTSINDLIVALAELNKWSLQLLNNSMIVSHVYLEIFSVIITYDLCDTGYKLSYEATHMWAGQKKTP